jgi:hypothetical protein
MLIDVSQDPGRGFRATLRTLKSPRTEIELRVKPLAANPEPDRSLLEVSRIVEALRFCGLDVCECYECVRHQVRAIVSQCKLASCEASATIRRIGENETTGVRAIVVSGTRRAANRDALTASRNAAKLFVRTDST